MPQWQYSMPLDPSCPEAEELLRRLNIALDDPMTQYAGVGGDISEDFERKTKPRHLAECKRCQEFGTANIEVVESW